MRRIVALFISCIFLWSMVDAETLYKTQEQADEDYNNIASQELKLEADKNNKKAVYMLALHKVHNKNEKEEGVQILKKLAAENITDAKHSLYAISNWVNAKNLTREEALNYLKEAAEEGYDVSQVDLAKAYIRGKFGKRDPEQSHYWLMKAAEQNNADAMAYVANDYFIGRGVARDDVKGFEWIKRAYNVLEGRFTDWRMLGQVYEEGIGTPVDLVRAYMCYDELGTAGIEEKARIAPRMTAAQREEGLRLSYEWQKKYHSYTMQSLGLKRQQDGAYQ